MGRIVELVSGRSQVNQHEHQIEMMSEKEDEKGKKSSVSPSLSVFQTKMTVLSSCCDSFDIQIFEFFSNQRMGLKMLNQSGLERAST